MTNIVLVDAIRDSFARTTYSHKTCEKQLEIQYSSLCWFRWIRFAVIAITASGTIGVIFNESKLIECLTAIFACISLLLNLYVLGTRPEENLKDLQRTTRDLWFVREKFFHLIADYQSGSVSDQQAIQNRDELLEKLNEAYHDAPQTSKRAYKKARKALNLDEEMTFSDKEIDNFLPDSLKKAKP